MWSRANWWLEQPLLERGTSNDLLNFLCWVRADDSPQAKRVAMTDATATSSSLRSFHLRVLFPYLLSLPKNDPRRVNAPPAITRSPAIDSELYTYIALLVRDFIHPWYRAVTNDHDFGVELVGILTRVIQQLETRFCEQVWTYTAIYLGILVSLKWNLFIR